ncbi:MAG: KpsF/GutQ family sugar-phosphate isomerase [Myxococcaceae bacterium]|nr:KpsF/GutQ family sugar-phosphate isomerase [Myxococcaceae bacterium]
MAAGNGFARTVLEIEAKAIASLYPRIQRSLDAALKVLRGCKGRVITTAIGKPGFIAQKLSATLASTGMPSLYLHPAEAAHGDLGRVAKGDVVIALSNSGASRELLLLLPAFEQLKVPVIAVTGDASSPLAKQKTVKVVIDIGPIDEACPIGLVPTASTAAMHAVCDALAMTLAHTRDFSADEYARLHPGGRLGRHALRVHEVMRTGRALPRVREGDALSHVVVVMTNTEGRPGAALVVDAKGKLAGIFTDGDLRRLAEQKRLDFSTPVGRVMGRRPRCVGPSELALAAAALMREVQVDQLPVVDATGKVVGLVDVQDLLAARIA